MTLAILLQLFTVNPEAICQPGVPIELAQQVLDKQAGYEIRVEEFCTPGADLSADNFGGTK